MSKKYPDRPSSISPDCECGHWRSKHKYSLWHNNYGECETCMCPKYEAEK